MCIWVRWAGSAGFPCEMGFMVKNLHYFFPPFIFHLNSKTETRFQHDADNKEVNVRCLLVYLCLIPVWQTNRQHGGWVGGWGLVSWGCILQELPPRGLKRYALTRGSRTLAHPRQHKHHETQGLWRPPFLMRAPTNLLPVPVITYSWVHEYLDNGSLGLSHHSGF